MKDKYDKFNLYMIIGFCVFALLMSVVFAFISGPLPPEKSLDQLQQENYRYEAEQRRIQESIELQREINKIKAGYYQ